MTPLPWCYDDGGRADAGYRGDARDCVTRAIAIATERSYQQVYDDLNMRARTGPQGRRKRASHSRTGVHPSIWKPYVVEAGGEWTPTMQIGSGCQVHLAEGELPAEGTLIVRLSAHISVVRFGIVRDTYDPSRDGTRCVYGYWTMP